MQHAHTQPWLPCPRRGSLDRCAETPPPLLPSHRVLPPEPHADNYIMGTCDSICWALKDAEHHRQLQPHQQRLNYFHAFHVTSKYLGKSTLESGLLGAY